MTRPTHVIALLVVVGFVQGCPSSGPLALVEEELSQGLQTEPDGRGIEAIELRCGPGAEPTELGEGTYVLSVEQDCSGEAQLTFAGETQSLSTVVPNHLFVVPTGEKALLSCPTLASACNAALSNLVLPDSFMALFDPRLPLSDPECKELTDLPFVSVATPHRMKISYSPCKHGTMTINVRDKDNTLVATNVTSKRPLIKDLWFSTKIPMQALWTVYVSCKPRSDSEGSCKYTVGNPGS